MISDTHRTQVLSAIPEDKLAAKRGRTRLGLLLATGGTGLVVVAVVLALRLIDGDGSPDKWGAVFVGIPFVAGFLFALIGAHVASGELVGAALRDIRDTAAVWRRS